MRKCARKFLSCQKMIKIKNMCTGNMIRMKKIKKIKISNSSTKHVLTWYKIIMSRIMILCPWFLEINFMHLKSGINQMIKFFTGVLGCPWSCHPTLSNTLKSMTPTSINYCQNKQSKIQVNGNLRKLNNSPIHNSNKHLG